jgi:hypothetical protein
MVDKALQDFATCSVGVTLRAVRPSNLSTYEKINFFNLLFITDGSVKHPNFLQICLKICLQFWQNTSNPRATQATSGHHNYRLPTRPISPSHQ